MSENEPDNLSAAADKIVFDVKSLVSLSGSDKVLRKTIEDRILSSHEKDLANFVSVIRSRQKTTQLGFLLISFGELILAAFLVIAGLAVIAPSILELSSPLALAMYYEVIVSGLSSSALSSPALALVNFLLAIVLLLAGFYSLREASSNLKETGMLSDPTL